MEAAKLCENSINLTDCSVIVKKTPSKKRIEDAKCFRLDDCTNISNKPPSQEEYEELEKLMGSSCQLDGSQDGPSVDCFTGERDINEILPEETWMTILMKKKFFDLLRKRDFNVDDYKPLQHLGLDKIQYREICFRFSKIYDSLVGEDGGELVKCDRCRRYTCLQGCVEERPQRVAVDIGSKLTWVISPSSELKRHQSILGIPKVVKCVDCDSITKHKFLSLRGVCKCQEPDDEKDHSQLRSNRSGGRALGIATSFLQHVLTQCSVLEGLRKPCGVLVLCEDVDWPVEVRRNILTFLFTHLKVSRVCMVPRPLAVCAELGLKTGVVVDSGALHTAVSVVLGGRVILSRSRELPVGGRHIAESLHYAHACDDSSQEIPVSSLDSADVKEQCWLSYNMATVEQRECTVRCESIWSWKQISLGNEVFRAPEYMYIQLDLPRVIVEVTQGLPEDQLRECLSHIALTGGNTCLAGFEQRLRRDLGALLPEHEAVIELVRGLGSRSCDAALGSTFIPFPMKQGILPEPPEPGTPCWISRDDFIFYGTERL
ncbi:hypothetical protein B566_EDAN006915 [Ephemera danica]|nr:hypothetical protein B566_EDAN006915 [Ephemera danica]